MLCPKLYSCAMWLCPVAPQENPDMFKWLTGQEPAPSSMQENSMFKVRGRCRLWREFDWWAVC